MSSNGFSAPISQTTYSHVETSQTWATRIQPIDQISQSEKEEPVSAPLSCQIATAPNKKDEKTVNEDSKSSSTKYDNYGENEPTITGRISPKEEEFEPDSVAAPLSIRLTP